MKKVLSLCLIMLIVVSMSIPAFAAPDGFVSSPSGTPAPGIVTFTPADEDCTAKLIITPYSDKQELTDNLLTMFEKAYNEVVASKDLTKLNDAFAKLANEKKLKGENLTVSDLFDIHVTGCDYHDGHTDFDITLDADTLSRFVALLHMKKGGEWELVKDAKVVNNGEHLQFSVDSFSPFAIVVDTSEGSSGTPQTGDNSMIYVYVIIMAVSALAIIVILVRNKKNKA